MKLRRALLPIKKTHETHSDEQKLRCALLPNSDEQKCIECEARSFTNARIYRKACESCMDDASKNAGERSDGADWEYAISDTHLLDTTDQFKDNGEIKCNHSLKCADRIESYQCCVCYKKGTIDDCQNCKNSKTMIPFEIFSECNWCGKWVLKGFSDEYYAFDRLSPNWVGIKHDKQLTSWYNTIIQKRKDYYEVKNKSEDDQKTHRHEITEKSLLNWIMPENDSS
jgi:hypothetical protein